MAKPTTKAHKAPRDDEAVITAERQDGYVMRGNPPGKTRLPQNYVPTSFECDPFYTPMEGSDG